MKGVVFMVVACVFVTKVKSVPVESKQVNLALETVLRFDNKDRASDLAVIDKVQNVLEKIKDAVQGRSARKSNTEVKNDLTHGVKQEIKLSDFILNAAKTLRKYNDVDLEDAYAVINGESRRYINRDTNLQQLFGNNFRRYMTDQLENVKNMPGNTLRRHLDKAIYVLEKKELTNAKSNILDIGNTLYTGASDKFKTALKKLDKLRRSNTDNLAQVLRDTLKSLVFDHYFNLNDNVKKELINIVRHYWRAFSSDNIGKITETVRTVTHNHRQRTKPATKQSRLTQKRFKISEKSPSVQRSIQKHNMGTRNEKNNKEEDMHNPDKGKTVFKLHYSLESTSSEESSDETRDSDSSDSDRSELLTGGQVRSIHLRGETSSYEVSKQSDEPEDINTREIVIQHSNVIDVGLSRKVPGRINVSFVSDERSKPDDLRRSDAVENGRRGFKVFPETVSHEGIRIESFENKDSAVRENMRKSNTNSTSELKINPKEPDNVEKLIENIEKQIADVKEQVEYVKKLRIGADHHESFTPVFKSVASGESFSNQKAETSKSPNSAIIENDNEAFFTDDSADKETSANKTIKQNSMDSVDFKTYDNTFSKRDSSEIEIKRNDTIETSNKSTTKKANVKIKISINNGTVNNIDDTSANVEDNKLNSNKTTLSYNETEVKNITVEQDQTVLSNGNEVNDKDHTNVTEVDKTNEEDFTNTITPLNFDISIKNVSDEINGQLPKDLGL